MRKKGVQISVFWLFLLKTGFSKSLRNEMKQFLSKDVNQNIIIWFDWFLKVNGIKLEMKLEFARVIKLVEKKYV